MRMTDIERIENRAGGVQPAIALLGVSQARWYDYRSGRVDPPDYIKASVRAHLLLSDRAIKRLVNVPRGT